MGKPIRENCTFNKNGLCKYPGLYDLEPRGATDLCVRYIHCDRFKDNQKKDRDDEWDNFGKERTQIQ